MIKIFAIVYKIGSDWAGTLVKRLLEVTDDREVMSSNPGTGDKVDGTFLQLFGVKLFFAKI